MNPYEMICRSAFTIELNANDFFCWASSEGIMFDTDDLEWALPIIEKYEEDGINAIMSYIRLKMPIEFWRNDNFKAAYKEIEVLNPKVASEEDFRKKRIEYLEPHPENFENDE